ncbi:hypothetical protein DFH07DRAFT_959910 [Mycena maculata]|uniref:Uncharacterized protein n=1 Tax=Mycena maculata TaxID=230809 RepID=A0AAD7NB03_9AGAR|nr:hypothetical protein DFH07DRAFT_959910 [Mycena maculata]
MHSRNAELLSFSPIPASAAPPRKRRADAPPAPHRVRPPAPPQSDDDCFWSAPLAGTRADIIPGYLPRGKRCLCRQSRHALALSHKIPEFKAPHTTFLAAHRLPLRFDLPHRSSPRWCQPPRRSQHRALRSPSARARPGRHNVQVQRAGDATARRASDKHTAPLSGTRLGDGARTWHGCSAPRLRTHPPITVPLHAHPPAAAALPARVPHRSVASQPGLAPRRDGAFHFVDAAVWCAAASARTLPSRRRASSRRRTPRARPPPRHRLTPGPCAPARCGTFRFDDALHIATFPHAPAALARRSPSPASAPHAPYSGSAPWWAPSCGPIAPPFLPPPFRAPCTFVCVLVHSSAAATVCCMCARRSAVRAGLARGGDMSELRAATSTPTAC